MTTRRTTPTRLRRRVSALALTCRQLGCKHCGQDIENFYPYPKRQWRDRGNNTHCPTPEGDAGQVHEPYEAH